MSKQMQLTPTEYAKLYGCNRSYIYRKCAANAPLIGVKSITRFGNAYVLNMVRNYEEKINVKNL